MIPFNPVTLRAPRLCRRVVRQFGVRIIALSGMLSGPAAAAPSAPPVKVEEVVRRPEIPAPAAPAPGITDSARYLFPDLATPGEGLLEIKPATAFTEDELTVLRSLNEQPTGQLIELLRIYERMGNTAMMQSVGRLLLKRVPDHPEALRLVKTLDENPEIRKPGYLEQTTAKLLAGEKTPDPDAVDAQANWLIAQKETEEALFVLEKLRELNFPGMHFPYLDSLAFCYFDLKRWDAAEKAFREVSKDISFTADVRQRADIQLEEIKIEKRITAATKEATDDPRKGLALSATLLKEYPQHPSVIAFRVDCLKYAGRPADALAFIEDLRASWTGAKVFPYQRLLAHAQLDLKRWDRARDSFLSLADNPMFDESARKDARLGLSATSIASKGERAVEAADRGEAQNAKKLIAELEAQFPGEIEVLGYKAAVLARLGEPDRSLQMLLDKKRQTGPLRRAYPLQDAIGDVYLERKEFENARAAYREILDNKEYDWDQRRRALDGIPAVRKVELLETAYAALRDRRPAKAREIKEKIIAELGSDLPEIAILEAEILLAEQKVTQARKQLQDLNDKTPPEKLFPAKSSLGTAYLQTGDWEKAIAVYSDLLERSAAFTPYELMEARWERRLAIPLVRPTATIKSSFIHEKDGSIFAADTDYDSPWWNGWKLGAFAHLEVVYLDDAAADPLIGDGGDRYEGGVRALKRIGANHAAELTVGASGDDALYGARFGRFLNPGLAWAAGFMGNARSTESLKLQAADARENQLAFQFGTPLPGPWEVNALTYAKWIRIGDDDLGHAVGGSAAIDYVWQTETEKRPEILIGYFGEYERFVYASEQKDASGDLLDPKTHRHGIQVAVRKNLNDKLQAGAQGGLYYAFDESSIGYYLGVGMHYYLSDEASLFAELRFDSDSKSSSAASGVLEASIGAAINF